MRQLRKLGGLAPSVEHFAAVVSSSSRGRRLYYERHSAEYLFVPVHKVKPIRGLKLNEPSTSIFDTPESLAAHAHELACEATVSEEESIQITNLLAMWHNLVHRGKPVPYPLPNRWPTNANPLIAMEPVPTPTIVERAANRFLLNLAANRSRGWTF